MKSSYRILAVSFALVLVGLIGAGPASAWTNADAKVILHIAPKGGKTPCPSGNLASCESAVTAGLSDPTGVQVYWTYILVSRFRTEESQPTIGLAGLQVAIDYDAVTGQGVDIYDWTLCAALQVPDPTWPAAMSSDLIAWNTATTDPQLGCQTDSVAVAGFFYMGAYSPDDLEIIPRPIDGKLKISDCSAAETELGPSAQGKASFSVDGSAPGINPCKIPVPTQPVSWGRIKGIYR
jgi:hypothetical protein